jgi:hypothetical protein
MHQNSHQYALSCGSTSDCWKIYKGVCEAYINGQLSVRLAAINLRVASKVQACSDPESTYLMSINRFRFT